MSRNPSGKKARLAILSAAAGVLAVLIGVGLYLRVSSHAVSKPVSLSGLYWIYYREDLSRLQPLDPSLIGQTLSGPGAYALEHNTTGNPLPSGVIPVQLFFSYADQQAALAKKGGILPGVQALADDPEEWSQTPQAEQQQPLSFMQQFASSAKSAGYKTVLIPGRDLVQVPGAACTQGKGQSLSQAYISCNLPSAAANADIYVIQGAQVENNLTDFTALVKGASQQARAANPNAVIVVTLTTTVNGANMGPGTINQAARAALPYVQGFEINTTAPTDSRFITFLHDLSGS
jgi:hypothetical protein